MILIGFDFSCNKPACAILKNGVLSLYVWPLELDKTSIQKLEDADIIVKNRIRLELLDSGKSSDKFRWHVAMANNLCNDILETLKNIIGDEKDIKIAFEGSSFGSKGDAQLQLSGYRYVLVNDLGKLYGLHNIYTYAPLTIKSVANCASKDKRGKDSMIRAFGELDIEHKFRELIRSGSDFLRKKTNYISCVDDIADAVWVMKTMKIKENL